jgi:hypothetical protein
VGPQKGAIKILQMKMPTLRICKQSALKFRGRPIFLGVLVFKKKLFLSESTCALDVGRRLALTFLTMNFDD